MATATFKQHFLTLKRGKPGKRFQAHYKHEKQARHGHNSTGRIVRLVLGLALVGVGLVFCVIPGPGLPIIFIGGAFLAAESLIVARAMDWAELRLRALWRWGKDHWDKLPLWGKIVVATLAAAGAAAGMWFMWQLMRG
jgi:hypothetical protein